ncbi:MAG: glycoside hydrolase family 18 protein [Puia sp.]|nr:glycoside hydrolase family 18 protein [Puia sp.]
MNKSLSRISAAAALILAFAVFSSYRTDTTNLSNPFNTPASFDRTGSGTSRAGRQEGPARKKGVVIGYVGGFRGLLHTDSIDAARLSIINYAFVDIKDDRAWLHNEATDTVNLRNLAGLKDKNPDLKIVISIGGWTWSKLFSDAVLTDSSRAVFASSSIELVSKYKLDGVDIDWEYPGMIGDGNKFRPEDKEGYTLFFKKLREGLDSLGKTTGQHYLITTAVGASEQYLGHTDMRQAALYLDYVNLMTYDFKEGEDSLSGHHTNLYASKDPHDPRQRSADQTVRLFEAAGVPASKLVMGMAFYGHGWMMKTDDNNGLYRPSLSPYRAGGYTYIKDSLIGQKGYVRHWDKNAHAPYLFQPEKKIFISYDDEASIRDKCKYVKKNKLAGVMFWEYNNDKKEYLLTVAADEMGY